LFSACVDLMATDVCQMEPPIHTVYQAGGHLPVNVNNVFARLARVPGDTPTSRRGDLLAF
jgi:hypothetical protein